MSTRKWWLMPNEELTFDLFHPHPLLIVLSGTSGVGKDAVLKGMRRRNLPLHYVVTATSRPARWNEVDGVDYFFYSKAEFKQRIDKGEFAEYALVYDDYKGIPRSQVDEALLSGRDVVIKVDVQGAATLRNQYPQAVLIFLLPNTKEEWCGRLMARNTETPDNLKIRIETAKKELTQIDMFDYIVINADDLLEKAVDDIIDIIKVEHQRVQHRKIN